MGADLPGDAGDATAAPGRQKDLESGPEPWRWLAWVLLAALVAIVVTWVSRRSSWYLAIDQFGYLTSASDLVAGRIAHPWALLPLLDRFMPEGLAADVLAQTYVYRQGALFCRYAPGFPLVLAASSVAFGPDSVHFVNAVAAGALLLTLFVLVRRILTSTWLALLVALLVTLLPTYVLLWSISPLRDVPAHTFALAALGALSPPTARQRRTLRALAAGFFLGFAVSTRVDALLYLLPALGLLWFWRPLGRREYLAALASFGIGLAPLLVHNAVATGNPLIPSQAMELENLLSRGAPRPNAIELEATPTMFSELVGPSSAYAQGGESAELRRARKRLQLEGGGLRLDHLASTLPQNLGVLEGVFGGLGAMLALIGGFAAFRRAPLFALTVPYITVATLFFSLWRRPDPRYLLGAILLVSILIVYGAAKVVASSGVLRRRGVGVASTLVVVGLSWGVVCWWVGMPDFSEESARPWVTLALEAMIGGGLLAGATLPARSAARIFAVGTSLLLALLVGWRSSTSLASRGSFQAEQVAVARQTIEEATGERAVIITTTDIGRPAENINFYTDVDAVYLREVMRWGITPPYFMDQLAREGFEVYLLLPPEAARRWITSNFVYRWFRPEMIAEVAPSEARRWFVASAQHDGVHLWFVRMHRRPEALPRE